MLQFIALFLPVYGIALIFCIAMVIPARRRFISIIGSLVILLSLEIFGERILIHGNLLGAVIFSFFASVLFLYYPALLIYWLLIKKKKKTSIETMSS